MTLEHPGGGFESIGGVFVFLSLFLVALWQNLLNLGACGR
jgi:hypothetical protein